MKHFFSALLTIAFVVGLSHTAAAQTEITVIGPGGVRASVEKLIPGFEAKTGYKVKPTYGSGGGTHAHGCRDGEREQRRCLHLFLQGGTEGGARETHRMSHSVCIIRAAPKPEFQQIVIVPVILR